MSDEKENKAVRAVRWLTEDGNYWKAIGFEALVLIGPFANLALSDEFTNRVFETGDPRRTPWARAWLAAFIVSLLLGAVAYIAGIRHDESARRRFEAEKKRLGDAFDDAVAAKEEAEARQSEREETIATLLQDVTTVVNGYLFQFAEAVLDFDDEDRASLYIHDGSRFVPIGRYSSHPRYRRKGRPFFPDDQGCIGAAWDNGESFLLTLPTDSAAYVQAHTDLGMSQDVVTALGMKPRFIYARRIDSTYKSPQEPLGVLVIESTKPARFKLEEIREFLEDEDIFLRSLIEVVRPHAPSVELMDGFLDG